MVGLERSIVVFGLISIIWFQVGCSQVVVPGTVAGAGELYRYSTGNVAKQAFVGNMEQTLNAAMLALERMDIESGETESTDSETILHAETPDMEIIIKFQPITSTVTHVSIDTQKGPWVKDKATAIEILSQIGTILKSRKVPRKHLSRFYVKNDCDRSVQVAIYYLAGSEEPLNWEAKGWFYLTPRTRKQIAETDNRYVYLYAESSSGKKFRWTGDRFQMFKGKPYGFFKIDMGPKIIDFTQNLICK